MPPSRQPLLWAALAYATGLTAGAYLWRPALWWILAAACFAIFTGYFLPRRTVLARALVLAVLFATGALAIQIRNPLVSAGSLPSFADGNEVLVTAHVVREGIWQSRGGGETRQQLDAVTEEIAAEDQKQSTAIGLRVGLYEKEQASVAEDSTSTPSRIFHYGDRLRFSAKLSSPHNFRNPGAFDYAGYLAENGITALASAKAGEVEALPGFVGNRFELWRTRIHRSIIQKVHALWPEEEAALMDAMVIGDDAFLDRPTRANFQRTGTYHVLVVSGMNVGILAFVVFWFLRRLRLSDALAGVLTVLLSVAYALLTDVGPPIWRATLMLTLFLGARLLYRDKSMLNAIGAAALGLLVVDPHILFGASFQLTFLCVVLIAAIAVPLLDRTSQPMMHGLRHLEATSYDFTLPPKITQYRLDLRLIAGRLARFAGKKIPLPLLAAAHRFALGIFEVLLISGIMQLGLVLPMAYYFHRVTVAGLAANLLVVPLTEILMPAAVLAMAVGYISVTLAKIPALVAGVALQAITGTVHWLGGIHIADARVPTPGLELAFFCAASLIATMLLARRRKLLLGAGLLGLAASAILICVLPWHPDIRHGALEVTAIDVGQGDSLLVVSPEGRTLLVDAGGMPYWMHSQFDVGEQVVSSYLWSRGVKHLDAVLITHPHADHMGGMAAVLENFHPREMWMGNTSASDSRVESSGAENSVMEGLLRKAQALGIAVIERQAGDTLDFGGASIRILAPETNLPSRSSQRNEDSMALKITFGNTSALLTGDIERATEKRIAREHPDADLLKVAHHGSATSTTSELLAAVHPHFAVISVGARNVYGHPRMEVLERLERAHVHTYRTDLDGAVTFYLDGEKVSPDLAALH